eukprot:SAG31_NODE_27810_length_419_cov_4.915625_1_plen_38_part_10
MSNAVSVNIHLHTDSTAVESSSYLVLTLVYIISSQLCR